MGSKDKEGAEGIVDGWEETEGGVVGASEGLSDGEVLGTAVGSSLGLSLGEEESEEGDSLGPILGDAEGASIGLSLGEPLGAMVAILLKARKELVTCSKPAFCKSVVNRPRSSLT